MRIRTVKPDFFKHEELFDLERESKLPLRIAFAGLWCAADREGRFKWRPRSLKAAILPYDNCDFSRVLHALTTRGFVVKYASNGEDFGWIPTFKRHQVINNRESPSELPEPDASTVQQWTSTRASRVSDACPTRVRDGKAEGKGREGNKEGKGMEVEVEGEGNGDARVGDAWNLERVPPTLDEVRAYVAYRKSAIDPERFFAHYQANGWVQGNDKKRIKNWGYALTTWEKNDRERVARVDRTSDPRGNIATVSKYIADLEAERGQ